MKAAETGPRRRGREPEPHALKVSPENAGLRTLFLELEPAIHRLGDGIEALQAAGTAADAIAPAAIAWFAETLKIDFEALRQVLEKTNGRVRSHRRGRRRG